MILHITEVVAVEGDVFTRILWYRKSKIEKFQVLKFCYRTSKRVVPYIHGSTCMHVKSIELTYYLVLVCLLEIPLIVKVW